MDTGAGTLSDLEMFAADVNSGTPGATDGTNTVNAQDASKILQYYLKYMDSDPKQRDDNLDTIRENWG
jgi:hypothetical protein